MPCRAHLSPMKDSRPKLSKVTHKMFTLDNYMTSLRIARKHQRPHIITLSIFDCKKAYSIIARSLKMTIITLWSHFTLMLSGNSYAQHTRFPCRTFIGPTLNQLRNIVSVVKLVKKIKPKLQVRRVCLRHFLFTRGEESISS